MCVKSQTKQTQTHKINDSSSGWPDFLGWLTDKTDWYGITHCTGLSHTGIQQSSRCSSGQRTKDDWRRLGAGPLWKTLLKQLITCLKMYIWNVSYCLVTDRYQMQGGCVGRQVLLSRGTPRRTKQLTRLTRPVFSDGEHVLHWMTTPDLHKAEKNTVSFHLALFSSFHITWPDTTLAPHTPRVLLLPSPLVFR